MNPGQLIILLLLTTCFIFSRTLQAFPVNCPTENSQVTPEWIKISAANSELIKPDDILEASIYQGGVTTPIMSYVSIEKIKCQYFHEGNLYLVLELKSVEGYCLNTYKNFKAFDKVSVGSPYSRPKNTTLSCSTQLTTSNPCQWEVGKKMSSISGCSWQ